MSVSFAEIGGLRERFGVQFKSGEVIFAQDDPGTELFVVLSGTVVFSVRDAGGKAQRLPRSAGPGDVFGEMSCFSDEPRSATAISLRDATALRLSREAALELVRASPVFGLKVIHSLAGRLRANLIGPGR
jgi:CRP-like cAMP-binding protein